MVIEQFVLKSDNMLLVTMGADRAEIIEILKKTIKELEDEKSTRSLFSKEDILYKLNNVLTLEIAKDCKNNVDLKEMQILADDCKGVDCHNCVFDNVVEMYDLWRRENNPLLERVIHNINELPENSFKSLQFSTDILISVIKKSIKELKST